MSRETKAAGGCTALCVTGRVTEHAERPALGNPLTGLPCEIAHSVWEFLDALALAQLLCVSRSLDRSVDDYIGVARSLDLPFDADTLPTLQRRAFFLICNAKSLAHLRIHKGAFPLRAGQGAEAEDPFLHAARRDGLLSALLRNNAATLQTMDVPFMDSLLALSAATACTRLEKLDVDISDMGAGVASLLSVTFLNCKGLRTLAFTQEESTPGNYPEPLQDHNVWPVVRHALSVCALTSLSLILGPTDQGVFALLHKQAPSITHLKLATREAMWVDNAQWTDAVATLTSLTRLDMAAFYPSATIDDLKEWALPPTLTHLETQRVGGWLPPQLLELIVDEARLGELKFVATTCRAIRSLRVGTINPRVSLDAIFVDGDAWTCPSLQHLNMSGDRVLTADHLLLMARNCVHLVVVSLYIDGSVREHHVAALLAWCPWLQHCTLRHPAATPERKAEPWNRHSPSEWSEALARVGVTCGHTESPIRTLALPSFGLHLLLFLDAPLLTHLTIANDYRSGLDVGMIATVFPALQTLDATAATIVCAETGAKTNVTTLALHARTIDIAGIGASAKFARVATLAIDDMPSLVHMQHDRRCFPALATIEHKSPSSNVLRDSLLMLSVCIARKGVSHVHDKASLNLLPTLAKLLASRR